VGPRSVAPGRIDADLPDHDAATMKRLFSRSMPDWADRAAVAKFAAEGAEIFGNDPGAARATAERMSRAGFDGGLEPRILSSAEETLRRHGPSEEAPR
jgi:hypothetical protein